MRSTLVSIIKEMALKNSDNLPQSFSASTEEIIPVSNQNNHPELTRELIEMMLESESNSNNVFAEFNVTKKDDGKWCFEF